MTAGRHAHQLNHTEQAQASASRFATILEILYETISIYTTLHSCHHLASRHTRVLAVVAWSRAVSLRLITLCVALILSTDLLDAIGTCATDGGSVTVVAVDTSKHLAVRRLDVFDGHSPLAAIAAAVTTRAVELAEVLDREAVDSHAVLLSASFFSCE